MFWVAGLMVNTGETPATWVTESVADALVPSGAVALTVILPRLFAVVASFTGTVMETVLPLLDAVAPVREEVSRVIVLVSTSLL